MAGTPIRRVIGESVNIGPDVLGENEALNPGQHKQCWIKIGYRRRHPPHVRFSAFQQMGRGSENR
jgi:hypothetical protein